MSLNISYLLRFGIFLLFVTSATTFAQTNNTPVGEVPNYYYFARPSDFTMKVMVSGEVRAPGLYQVKEGLKLNELLSLAGGPVIVSRPHQDERMIFVRVSRKTESGRVIIYDETFENFMVSIEDFIEIKEGDIIYVESVVKQGFSKRDILPIAGIIVGVLGVIANVVRN